MRFIGYSLLFTIFVVAVLATYVGLAFLIGLVLLAAGRSVAEMVRDIRAHRQAAGRG